MASRSPGSSTTQTSSPFRLAAAQMLQGSSSEKVKQQEQSWIELCRLRRAFANCLEFSSGLRRRLRASLVAVFLPIPGNCINDSINRSKAGGTTCIISACYMKFVRSGRFIPAVRLPISCLLSSFALRIPSLIAEAMRS